MTVKCWNVGCGDAITISTLSPEGKPVNLFIDGGYAGTYRSTIKRELLAIRQRNEMVDRWIITHTDQDHIGGVAAFLKDNTMKEKEQLVGEYWFNWSSYPFKAMAKELSTGQGMDLRDYLAAAGKLSQQDILMTNGTTEWMGINITILSPNAATLEKSKQVWSAEEKKKPLGARQSDYDKTIEALLEEPFCEDTDPFNGGSIALLVEQNGRSILLLGDAYPSVIIESLLVAGYSKERKLKVDYIKLSHHGSKHNFDTALLSLVNCNHFIISGNGVAKHLPDKWTLAQIIASPERNSQPVHFYFTGDSPQLRCMFAVDQPTDKYRFVCHYNNDPYLIFHLS